ncbi:MAG: hypothetical protein ABIO02_01230, partial [Patescibacteria group bacterium]
MPKITKSKEPVRKTRVVQTPPETMDEQPQYYAKPVSQTPNIMILLLVALLSFSVGYLFSQVKTLASGKTTTTAPTGTQAAAQQPAPDINVTVDQVKKLFDTQKLKFGD